MNQGTVDGLLTKSRPIIDAERPLACDTEITRRKEPYCLTLSSTPGSGWLILATDTHSLNWFQKVLDRHNGPILFHNWMFDQEVVLRMGLRFPTHLIVDTMVRCFHLGNVPQGLKALAYRELGMKMTDFMDTVLPHSTPLALKYLREAALVDWPKPEEDVVRDQTGEWKLYKPQSMSTKLKRFFSDYTKNPNKSPFDAWDNWEESHKMVQDKLGPWPGICITHVPLSEIIHYACRDSDALLRLWPVLQKMTRMVRRKPQERWND